jgi:hypothetical protein
MCRSILNRDLAASLPVATSPIVRYVSPSSQAPGRTLQAPVLGHLATLDCKLRTNLYHARGLSHGRSPLSKNSALEMIVLRSRIMRELPTSFSYQHIIHRDTVTSTYLFWWDDRNR